MQYLCQVCGQLQETLSRCSQQHEGPVSCVSEDLQKRRLVQETHESSSQYILQQLLNGGDLGPAN